MSATRPVQELSQSCSFMFRRRTENPPLNLLDPVHNKELWRPIAISQHSFPSKLISHLIPKIFSETSKSVLFSTRFSWDFDVSDTWMMAIFREQKIHHLIGQIQYIFRKRTMRINRFIAGKRCERSGHAFLLSESQYLNILFHHISWNLAWIMSKLQHFICKTKKIFSFGFPLDPRLSSQIQRNPSGSPPDFHEISAFLTTGLFYSDSIIYSGFTDVFLSCWTFPAAYFLGFQMKFLARSGSFWNLTFPAHLAAF